MSIDELVRIAERYGLPTEAIADLTSLLRRVSMTTRGVGAVSDAEGTLLGEDAIDDGDSGTLLAGGALEPVADGLGPKTIDLGSQEEAAADPERRPLQGPDRYDQFVDISLLGVGAMGRVRRVRDPALNRTMALKTLRPEVMYNPSAVLRFTEEAQTTAQLQHPGILPVFETGRTRDGRLWFTMQEVRGQTLRHVLAEVHAASAEGRWRPSESGWTLQRTIEAFRRVCDAVAYAHSRGVVHRDLKPSNVMVGQHGEVLVVDWGLAKIVGAPDPDVDTDVVVTTRTGNDAQETVSGTIAGTPMYMAPEQARGEIHMIDARTDVYALGAMLYEILAGRGPYQGVDATDVLSQLLAGPPSQLRANVGLDPRTGRETAPMAPFVGLGLPVPEELVDACNRAMERDPADRYPDAGALGADIGAWLDGSRRRERALEVVDEARRALPKADELRHRGRVLRESAARTLDAVPLWAAEEEKAPGWARLDEAARLERKAEKLELDHELLLHGALTHEPHLPEAHQALADRYRANHEAAEDARDAVAAARAENLLRIHAAALPEGSAVRAAHFRYLAGDGLVSLTTDPRGAEVVLYDNVTRNRRIVPGAARTIGFTPLRAVPLPMGSYLAVLRSDGHEPVHYPIHVRREEHVGTIRFGSADAGAIALPRNGELGRNDVYVPAGACAIGGDPDAPNSLPGRRVWVDAFVIKRFPVTNAEYIVFLDALAARGDEELALRHAPRERAASGEDSGVLIYGRDADGRFVLQPDGDGDVWRAEWPVMMVDWEAARAYTTWLADRDGLPWRLPHEVEWEKAARGADGRSHPWGDAFDPSWCHVKDSHSGPPMIAVIDSYPTDESPYGVRGMAANTSEWCANAYRAAGPELDGDRLGPVGDCADEPDVQFWVVRGGAWYDQAQYARAATRRHQPPGTRRSDIGFRVARSF